MWSSGLIDVVREGALDSLIEVWDLEGEVGSQYQKSQRRRREDRNADMCAIEPAMAEMTIPLLRSSLLPARKPGRKVRGITRDSESILLVTSRLLFGSCPFPYLFSEPSVELFSLVL